MHKEPQVDIWQVSLDAHLDELDDLTALLSDHQIAKAQRLKNEQAKTRYIIAQATTRKILAGYLSIEPSAVKLEYGEHGKPYISNYPLYFNISHAHELALIAICKTHEIGIDIEYWRQNIHQDAIIKRHFHPDEIAQYESLPAELHQRSFYFAWTCKEAFVKAIGTGMQQKFKSFVVEMDPRQPPKLRSVPPILSADQGWCLHNIQVPGDYTVMLAISDSNPKINAHTEYDF